MTFPDPSHIKKTRDEYVSFVKVLAICTIIGTAALVGLLMC